MSEVKHTEWQPIETAPRDGQWFIIGNNNEDDFFEVGRFNPYETTKFIEVEDGLYRKVYAILYDWDGFNNFHRATHWLPFPKLPREGRVSV